MAKTPRKRIFPSAGEDLQSAKIARESDQTRSPSYRLAFADDDFLSQDALRPVRLQLELLKPELLLQEYGVTSTVVVFGSARLPGPEEAARLCEDAERNAANNPDDADAARAAAIARCTATNSRYYEEARRFAQLISEHGKAAENGDGDHHYVVITGGGGGIMEAANRGAQEVGARSIGLNIVLPKEQSPNQYITPDLCFQFHYFAIRKMHFLMRARALSIFPGGFGTLDELFDALTLIQTGKIAPLPVIMFGRDYWSRVINFDVMVDEGTISAADRDLITFVDSAEEAADIVKSEPMGSAYYV